MNRLFFADPENLESIVRPQALADALQTWGVRVEERPGDTVPLVCGRTVAPGKTLRLLPSWLDGYWRVTEENGAGDARPARIAQRQAAGLDLATIHAAASGFPDTACGEGVFYGQANDPDTWRALASGRETVVAGEGGLRSSGLCHLRAPRPGDARRNARDGARRWLTSDLLSSAVPAEPEALAWLVADALAGLAQEPPRVSIVINNHNYSDYIGAAIESALDQSVAAHEVIVVDDGSTDASRAVIAGYRGLHAIIKPNGGQGSAFNAGFSAASGDLVVFLDADDRLAPDAVAVLRDQDLDGIARLSFGLETIDAAGRRTGLFPTTRLADGGALAGRLLRQGFLQMMPTSGNAFTRATLERLLPMPEAQWRTSADVYLVFGATFLGPARIVDRVLGQYRVHGRNAYHTTFGTEAQHNPRKLAQRRRAFGDLARRMEATPDFGTPRDAAALRAMAEPGSLLRRIEAWRSDLMGLRAPLSMPPPSDGRRVLPPLGRLRRHLRESDPARFGGVASWPCLGPGTQVDLIERVVETPLGDGWVWESGRGARLTGGWASLAFRVPGPRADWQIDLHHRSAKSGRVAVWVNGTRLDDLWTVETGSASLNLGGDLLIPDQRTRSWRLGITLVPETDAGIRLTALSARPVLPAMTGAPVLRAGATVLPRDATGCRVLAEGWSWPGEDGARMAEAEATLRFSVAEAGQHVLHIDVDLPPIMVTVEGQPVATIPDAGGRGIHVPLPAGLIPPSGDIAVSILAPDGVWPRLHSLRLCRAIGPNGAVPPGEVVPVGDMPRHEADDGTVTLSLPQVGDDALLLLLEPVEGAPAPRRADLTIDGRTLAVLGAGEGVTVIATGASARLLTCRTTDTLRIRGVARAPVETVSPTAPEEIALEARQLLERARVPGAWVAADDDALWLSWNRTDLALTRPPCARELRATVLGLPGTGQTLTLRLGTSVARTKGSGGVETLVLPLPEGEPGEPLRLFIETDTLVEAGGLGVDMPGMLGGALVRVDFGSFEEPPASVPQAEDQT
jgi:hypothetical protein